jgi:hypothetical protein
VRSRGSAGLRTASAAKSAAARRTSCSSSSWSLICGKSARTRRRMICLSRLPYAVDRPMRIWDDEPGRRAGRAPDPVPRQIPLHPGIVDLLGARRHPSLARLGILGALLRTLASAFRSRTAPALENLALRQQLATRTAGSSSAWRSTGRHDAESTGSPPPPQASMRGCSRRRSRRIASSASSTMQSPHVGTHPAPGGWCPAWMPVAPAGSALPHPPIIPAIATATTVGHPRRLVDPMRSSFQLQSPCRPSVTSQFRLSGTPSRHARPTAPIRRPA